MKAFKVELLIIDHDGLGAEQIKDVLENTKYPNWCISPEVMDVDERDIGEWHDGHPLNLLSKREAEYRLLFLKPTKSHDARQFTLRRRPA